MPTSIATLVDAIEPKHTVLLFGAGSSIPSGAPSSGKLTSAIAKAFNLPESGYSLRETSSLAEDRPGGRPKLIKEVRRLCSDLRPTGGIRNVPLYTWKSIFTTNYDTLIEQAYALRGKTYTSLSSDFDFHSDKEPTDISIFKIHGTIDKDIVDNYNSRIILTDRDFDNTETYRDFIYDRFRGDIAGSHIIIIGHSLIDDDIKSIIDRAASINARLLSPAQIALLLYEADENRALLYERRGMTVCFGGIDSFFAAVAAKEAARAALPPAPGNEPLDVEPVLRAITIDVPHASRLAPDVSGMFHGWPATYADIVAGHTFSRTISDSIIAHLESENALTATLLGASGVGKSTAARQVLTRMQQNGWLAWEHKTDFSLSAEGWEKVAGRLSADGLTGVLLVDDAHQHLYPLNELIDRLAGGGSANLKILIVSTRNAWYPRIKTPNVFRFGKEFILSQLTYDEIDKLLTLVEQDAQLRVLVGEQFSGFSRAERRRRLSDRCQADMFVCLKNIFASDSFDNILLREYASLGESYQDVYKVVAALESSGVRVHRQLIVRLLGIPADHIQAILVNLTDIVMEYDIQESIGIFGWRCRHPVISMVVTKFKYSDSDQTIELYERVIDSISPSYDIEIRSLRELCSSDFGIARIADKHVQNRLLRKMMSIAPGERVPRHRLIRNLIEGGEFDRAETEIRIFEKDFGADSPVYRYRIRLVIEKAVSTPGILKEDRIAYLRSAHEMALVGANRYQNNVLILSAFGDLGIEYYRLTGGYEYFDEAISLLKKAESFHGDPQIGRLIVRLERRLAGRAIDPEPDVEE